MKISSGLLKSISLELSKIGLKPVYKPWESNLLNLNVIDLVWNSQPEEKISVAALRGLERRLAAFKPCLLTARILTLNQKARRVLEDSGFHLMECYLEFEHNLELIPSVPGKISIRPFLKDDIPELEKIAFVSFQYDRFHMDSQIKPAQANATRSAWVKNACLGRAKAVFVAEIDSRPAGFVVCKEKKLGSNKMGILDLIAVHTDYRGRKLGSAMVAEFLKFCRKQHYYSGKTGTQAHNIPSVAMYEKAGFLMAQSYYTYHKHLV